MATVLAEKRITPTTAEDDGVREAHGVFLGDKPIALLSEQGNRVVLIGNYSDKLLTPRQARYLAGKLYRLARRIEKREIAA